LLPRQEIPHHAVARAVRAREGRDGRFATLLDVVSHYNTALTIGLSDAEKNDLVEYLKSL